MMVSSIQKGLNGVFYELNNEYLFNRSFDIYIYNSSNLTKHTEIDYLYKYQEEYIRISNMTR